MVGNLLSQLSTFFTIVDSHRAEAHCLRKLHCQVTNASNAHDSDYFTTFDFWFQFSQSTPSSSLYEVSFDIEVWRGVHVLQHTSEVLLARTKPLEVGGQ